MHSDAVITGGYSHSVVVEEHAMTMEPPRQVQLQPQTAVQLAHATSDAVVQGLGKSPYLLGLVVLVSIGVGAAVYFLNLLISGQQQHLKSLMDTQQHSLEQMLTMHKGEFDALMEQNNRLSIPVSPIAPSSQIVTQPSAPPPARPR
jgi:uncharacterized protein HemX